ncbi:N-acetylmuramoyl-L-alanine amidase [Cytobacillus horneckiae]|uniref:N-acetylmuramoyl-L-alanine amidase n=1 Tax=Cytobacillus horneckiae TaxID=549687 RepID=A0A2N0ZCC6_9BACI|nr:N-acetylmuramoyl-L-alanine amidase [Cytobacillus horneckiae]MBN6889583.1 N-acetylmuramoyl-L-alanine amidase [Cytobacillus horneckiae]MCM3180946.1 N-acetylmuramoyl-L-alanine amidase [Cytobacillus horneckiae]MEC1158114.1 N-acetylmuramoyl-L-alanine amidase [Cytobacillus horneckiae]MED2936385.1 N-acetylmuramoyl-L-alanine amidase [Cytobacillus horneckiae]PKG27181.1 N-acetylmuramoyl-L-alanine amidase [Cytobacillus horneckiae]
MVKIFIDPGHGGTDPGSIGNSLYEKQLTLSMALKIKAYLEEYEDVEIKMSRTGDQTRSLKQRTDEANAWGADVFVSPHVNAGGGEGYEDFIYPGVKGITLEIQDAIHDAVIKETGFNDRGQKQGNLHVLRESHMPAIHTENGFIDRKSDADNLKQTAFINKIARGHVNGLVKVYKLEKKKESESKPNTSSKTHKIAKGDTFYSLAKKYNTTVSNLRKLNTGVEEKNLQIGQTIKVLSTAKYHTVKSGDTVSELAAKYGSTIKQIRDWNKLDSKYTIYPNQKLRVK